MTVEYKVFDQAWIDKNVDNDIDYPPNFCTTEDDSQFYMVLQITDKRE